MSQLRPSVSVGTIAKPPEVAEAAEALADEHGPGPFRKTVVVMIVLTTLAAAAVEALHEDDARRAERAAVTAQRLAMDSVADETKLDSQLGIDVENFVLAQRQRAAAASVHQQLVNPPKHGLSAQDKTRMSNDERTSLTEAGLTQQTTSIDPAGPFGPDADDAFPNRLLAASSRELSRKLGVIELSTAEHAKWAHRAVNYLAILTLFAVAVYLMGLSLIVAARRIRNIMAWVGIGLVIAGLGWTIGTRLPAVPEPSDAAATEYALGHEALLTASAHPGYELAKMHLTRAIALDSTFARAYLERSIAEFFLGTPPGDKSDDFSGGSFVFSSSASELARNIADLKQAERLGMRTGLVEGNIADDSYLLWTRTGGSDLLLDALNYVDKAVARDPSEPSVYFYRAVELLAMGRVQDAHDAYTRAIASLNKRTSVNAQVYVSLALTELELLADHRGRTDPLDPAIREVKERIVAAAFPSSSTHSPSRVDAEVAIEQPGALAWDASTEGFDSANDSVTVEWYYRHRGGTWSNLFAGSGPLSACQAQSFGCLQTESSRLANYFELLKQGNQCLGDGDYRVEIYVNGGLASRSKSANIELNWDNLRERRATDLGMAFCGREDWSALPGVTAGLMRGFGSSDGSYGYYAVRLEHPSSEENSHAVVNRDIHRVVDEFGSGRLPGSLRLDHERDVENYKALQSPQAAYYVYPQGKMLVAGGFAGDAASGFSTGQPYDKATIVVAVWGPPSFMDPGGGADELIGSLTSTWMSAFDNGAKVQPPSTA